MQAPPTVRTPEKSQDDEEAMPPYDVDTQALIDGWFSGQSGGYLLIQYREIRLFLISFSQLFIVSVYLPTVLWFTAAQKARDDFEEAEKALREMDDQIGFVQYYILRGNRKTSSLKSSGSVANWFFVCNWNSLWSSNAYNRVHCVFSSCG